MGSVIIPANRVVRFAYRFNLSPRIGNTIDAGVLSQSLSSNLARDTGSRVILRNGQGSPSVDVNSVSFLFVERRQCYVSFLADIMGAVPFSAVDTAVVRSLVTSGPQGLSLTRIASNFPDGPGTGTVDNGIFASDVTGIEHQFQTVPNGTSANVPEHPTGIIGAATDTTVSSSDVGRVGHDPAPLIPRLPDGTIKLFPDLSTGATIALAGVGTLVVGVSVAYIWRSVK